MAALPPAAFVHRFSLKVKNDVAALPPAVLYLLIKVWNEVAALPPAAICHEK